MMPTTFRALPLDQPPSEYHGDHALEPLLWWVVGKIMRLARYQHSSASVMWEKDALFNEAYIAVCRHKFGANRLFLHMYHRVFQLRGLGYKVENTVLFSSMDEGEESNHSTPPHWQEEFDEVDAKISAEWLMKFAGCSEKGREALLRDDLYSGHTLDESKEKVGLLGSHATLARRKIKTALATYRPDSVDVPLLSEVDKREAAKLKSLGKARVGDKTEYWYMLDALLAEHGTFVAVSKVLGTNRRQVEYRWKNWKPS